MTALVLCVIGPPGSGKGTHTNRLIREVPDGLNISRLSIGDALRARNLPCSSGELCFNEEIESIIDEHIVDDHVIILDGYPRSLKQMEMLYDRSIKDGHKLLAVFNLTVLEPEVLMERLRSRFTCKSCGYAGEKGENSLCPVCSENLSIRADDLDQKAILRRIEVYQESLESIKDFCIARGIEFADFDGTKPAATVYTEIEDKFLDVIKKCH